MKRLKKAEGLHLSIFSEAPISIQHEGTLNVLRREDGAIKQSESERIEANALLHYDYKHPERLTLEKVIDFIDQLAEKLAENKFRLFIRTINEAVEEVGNVVDAARNRVEAFFEMIEKRQLEFDENNNPIHPQLLAGSQAVVDRFHATLEEIGNSPQLRKRMEAIFDKKWMEWRDRETARYLVG